MNCMNVILLAAKFYKKKYFIISPKKIEIVPYLLKLANLIQRNQFLKRENGFVER